MKAKIVGLAIALLLGLGLVGSAAAANNGQTGYEGQPGNQSSSNNNNNNNGNGLLGYEGRPGNQGGR